MRLTTEDALQAALVNYDSQLKLKEKQKEALHLILDHCHDKIYDIIISLPTGYGKSLIYSLLPNALRQKKDQDKGSVLVICPLNLIQSDQMRNLAAHNVPSCSLSQDCKVTTVDEDMQSSLEDVTSGKFDLIFAHPEALFNTPEGETLLNNKDFQRLIIAVVVDECHTVESWWVSLKLFIYEHFL